METELNLTLFNTEPLETMRGGSGKWAYTQAGTVVWHQTLPFGDK